MLVKKIIKSCNILVSEEYLLIEYQYFKYSSIYSIEYRHVISTTVNFPEVSDVLVVV
jgi:hypothetical protein